MAGIESMKLTLTADAKDFLRRQVSVGRFESEDEIVEAALDNYRSDLEEESRWEQEVLLPAYAEYKADPSAVRTMEEVEASLASARLQRLQAS